MMMENETDKQSRISDALMLERFQTSKKRPPCTDTLGMKLTSVNQESMEIIAEFVATKSFTNPTGAIQGGFITAMLDEAISTNIIIASNVTMSAPTLEMKTSYLSRLMPGTAIVKARILKFGKSACFSEATCYDSGGNIVATATATALPKLFKKF